MSSPCPEELIRVVLRDAGFDAPRSAAAQGGKPKALHCSRRSRNRTFRKRRLIGDVHGASQAPEALLGWLAGRRGNPGRAWMLLASLPAQVALL